MDARRTLWLNAVTSAAFTALSGVVYFALYQVVLRQLGLGPLGVWSVAVSVASLGSLADLGIGAGTVKFVAKYEALGRPETLSPLLQTAQAAGAGSFALVAVALLILHRAVFSWFLPAENVPEAVALFPWLLGSLGLSIVSGVWLSALEGLRLGWLKNAILAASLAVNLGACVALIGGHGLVGLAFGRLAGAAVALAGSAFALKAARPGLRMAPRGFKRGLFREILGYGINLQVTSLAVFLFEPVTKMLLAKFSGISTAGLFELASKI